MEGQAYSSWQTTHGLIHKDEDDVDDDDDTGYRASFEHLNINNISLLAYKFNIYTINMCVHKVLFFKKERLYLAYAITVSS
jgi:hypothetical protein